MLIIENKIHLYIAQQSIQRITKLATFIIVPGDGKQIDRYFDQPDAMRFTKCIAM